MNKGDFIFSAVVIAGFLFVWSRQKAAGAPIFYGGDVADVVPGGAPQSVLRWLLEARNAYRETGITPLLLLSVIWQESAGNPNAVGSVGEVGLMQVKESTAGDFGVSPDELAIPQMNIIAGARFLSWLNERTDSVYDLLRAYNAGLTGSRRNPANGAQYANQVIAKLNS